MTHHLKSIDLFPVKVWREGGSRDVTPKILLVFRRWLAITILTKREACGGFPEAPHTPVGQRNWKVSLGPSLSYQKQLHDPGDRVPVKAPPPQALV